MIICIQIAEAVVEADTAMQSQRIREWSRATDATACSGREFSFKILNYDLDHKRRIE